MFLGILLFFFKLFIKVFIVIPFKLLNTILLFINTPPIIVTIICWILIIIGFFIIVYPSFRKIIYGQVNLITKDECLNFFASLLMGISLGIVAYVSPDKFAF